MNELEKAIQNAFNAQGNSTEANKVYLEFIKANFIIPVENNADHEEPHVLYLPFDDKILLPVFTSISYLDNWAVDIKEKIQLLKLSGVDLLKGVGEDISVSLNIGTAHYKEFNPAELARMRSMVLKFFSQH